MIGCWNGARCDQHCERHGGHVSRIENEAEELHGHNDCLNAEVDETPKEPEAEEDNNQADDMVSSVCGFGLYASTQKSKTQEKKRNLGTT